MTSTNTSSNKHIAVELNDGSDLKLKLEQLDTSKISVNEKNQISYDGGKLILKLSDTKVIFDPSFYETKNNSTICSMKLRLLNKNNNTLSKLSDKCIYFNEDKTSNKLVLKYDVVDSLRYTINKILDTIKSYSSSNIEFEPIVSEGKYPNQIYVSNFDNKDKNFSSINIYDNNKDEYISKDLDSIKDNIEKDTKLCNTYVKINNFYKDNKSGKNRLVLNLYYTEINSQEEEEIQEENELVNDFDNVYVIDNNNYFKYRSTKSKLLFGVLAEKLEELEFKFKKDGNFVCDLPIKLDDNQELKDFITNLNEYGKTINTQSTIIDDSYTYPGCYKTWNSEDGNKNTSYVNFKLSYYDLVNILDIRDKSKDEQLEETLQFIKDYFYVDKKNEKTNYDDSTFHKYEFVFDVKCELKININKLQRMKNYNIYFYVKNLRKYEIRDIYIPKNSNIQNFSNRLIADNDDDELSRTVSTVDNHIIESDEEDNTVEDNED